MYSSSIQYYGCTSTSTAVCLQLSYGEVWGMAARICMQLFCMKSFSSSPRNSAKLMTFNMPDVWHIESSIWRCSMDSGLQDPKTHRWDIAMIIPSSSAAARRGGFLCMESGYNVCLCYVGGGCMHPCMQCARARSSGVGCAPLPTS